MERRRHNNGMQRTRATAFLSYTLNGRSPLMPGVGRLHYINIISGIHREC